MDQSHIYSASAGAVTLAVAAPVVISMTGLISLLWPVIPLLAVGAIFLSVNKTNNNKSHDNNDNDKAKGIK